MTVRSTLARSKVLRTVHDGVVRRRYGRTSTDVASFDRLAPSVVVRLAYEALLRRSPGREEVSSWAGRVDSGELTRGEIFQAFHAADEYARLPKFGPALLGPSIHSGRQQFVRSLPRAARIVDLGGANLGDDVGAFVAMGYPYRFEELTVIDLPSEDRHDIYRTSRRPDVVRTAKGTVTYRYHPMTDLSSFDDESVDLVYSGQSFEHVGVEDGAIVLKEVSRILRPGGYLAMDTPNGRVTRMQQETFIDPDHKVEYTYDELQGVLTSAGYTILTAKGLNYGGESVSHGHFDLADTAGNPGLYDELEDCYILCLVCQKPSAA